MKLNVLYSTLSGRDDSTSLSSPLFLSHPSSMPYQMFFTSATPTKDRRNGLLQPIYLIRQYFETSLEHRLSTRPFLADVEKRFITHQLLGAVEKIHGDNITHGDLKPSNVMITSYNHVIITDFAR